jgi:ArsR family transcriptional regulator
MLNKQTEIFKSLSDPNRIRILKMLQIKPLCVCEITDILGLAPSTVSEHLSVLKKSGFITDKKDGKWINYHLKNDSAEPELASLLTALHFMVQSDQTIKGDRKKLAKVDRNKLKNSTNR